MGKDEACACWRTCSERDAAFRVWELEEERRVSEGHSGTAVGFKSFLNPASPGDTTQGQLRKLSLGRGTSPRSHRE